MARTSFSLTNPFSTAIPGRRRRRGYRTIAAKIVEEEKERARQELADLVYSMIWDRVWSNEKRSDNNRPLPSYSQGSLYYRALNPPAENAKLVQTGDMRQSLKVWATKQKLNVSNTAVAKRGRDKGVFQYAQKLNTLHYRKRWVNLDIPNTFLPGGSERKRWIARYRQRLSARFNSELYY